MKERYGGRKEEEEERKKPILKLDLLKYKHTILNPKRQMFYFSSNLESDWDIFLIAKKKIFPGVKRAGPKKRIL